MNHVPADPRDGRWEIDRPVYRVYFWRPDGGACREYELREAADVSEVLEWARSFPETEPGLNDWVPEVWVAHRDRIEALGLIRLMGAVRIRRVRQRPSGSRTGPATAGTRKCDVSALHASGGG